ncbi:MAG TPA: urease accessory protein UreE [Candidatus Competibacteraceae bacterium]|nr:urease accessory protein UreE [Candidatus Competibacteraceae bacterium]
MSPLTIQERLATAASAAATLTLPFEARCKSRLLTRLDDGTPVGLFLPRGTVLRDGDCLRAADGRVVEVRAAAEAVSIAHADDLLTLVRAAYHLGNRHVPVQLGDGWLRYPQDHVLDELVRQLGLYIEHELAPFEPEAGAYGTGHHHG